MSAVFLGVNVLRLEIFYFLFFFIFEKPIKESENHGSNKVNEHLF